MGRCRQNRVKGTFNQLMRELAAIALAVVFVNHENLDLLGPVDEICERAVRVVGVTGISPVITLDVLRCHAARTISSSSCPSSPTHVSRFRYKSSRSVAPLARRLRALFPLLVGWLPAPVGFKDFHDLVAATRPLTDGWLG